MAMAERVPSRLRQALRSRLPVHTEQQLIPRVMGLAADRILCVAAAELKHVPAWTPFSASFRMSMSWQSGCLGGWKLCDGGQQTTPMHMRSILTMCFIFD